MSSSASADFSAYLEIMRIGNVLLMDPPSSDKEMIKLLDTADNILSSMEQTLPDSQKDVLLPITKVLITNNILKSQNKEIGASAASCLAELMRIAAPDAPSEDDIMEVYITGIYSTTSSAGQNFWRNIITGSFSVDHSAEVFQLMAETFTMLSQTSGRCYEKAATTLYTVARVKACLLMLDLE